MYGLKATKGEKNYATENTKKAKEGMKVYEDSVVKISDNKIHTLHFPFTLQVPEILSCFKGLYQPKMH